MMVIYSDLSTGTELDKKESADEKTGFAPVRLLDGNAASKKVKLFFKPPKPRRSRSWACSKI
jgi:hypothetical protein